MIIHKAFTIPLCSRNFLHLKICFHISCRHVLTAAHCVKGDTASINTEDSEMRFGITNLRKCKFPAPEPRPPDRLTAETIKDRFSQNIISLINPLAIMTFIASGSDFHTSSPKENKSTKYHQVCV